MLNIDVNIESHKIDDSKISSLESISFEKTIDNYVLSPSKEELEQYHTTKKIHKQCLKWIEKFNNTNTTDDFMSVAKKYKKSKLSPHLNIKFFIYNYASSKIGVLSALNNIMEFLSSTYGYDRFINGLCLFFPPDDVSKLYKKASYRCRSELKDYIELLKQNRIKYSYSYFFDKTTHFYCEKIIGYEINPRYPKSEFYRFFESFDEFVAYRKGDLTSCDLSNLLDCTINFKNYKIDCTTKLPPYSIYQEEYILRKYFSNGEFYVIQQWRGPSNSLLKQYHHTFKDFYSFVAFLKGDLSEADLISYDELIDLQSLDFIDFTNAKLTSTQSIKLGLPYKTIPQKTQLLTTFKHIEQNELETALIRQSNDRHMLNNDDYASSKGIPIHYISDLHLSHLIKNSDCHSYEDVVRILRKTVNEITNTYAWIILIAGDVASDFDTFQLFVKLLGQRTRDNTTVIFTLGNHELWDFAGFTSDEIVFKYRTFLEEQGMYLLHNDILYAESPYQWSLDALEWHLLPYSELSNLTDIQIKDRLNKARYVFFGGLGFSAYSPNFNANHKLYRNTIDYNDDLIETFKFESLHNRLLPILQAKNSVVVTHTPKECWSKDTNYPSNVVYVSGHTHRNFFYDDGETRLYADNQCGYNCKTPRLKWFHFENTLDVFADYDDGIHIISRNQYVDFYRELNILMTFHRKIRTLYMLKKQGYYCFIAEIAHGKLSILNGGTPTQLPFNNIQYYYDNMDKVISKLKSPLTQYTDYQNRISHIIKRIGGGGWIHGCIIDIDFYNHIFVNPFDSTLTAYWASDMVHKYVFPSIPALLKTKRPELYNNLIEFLNSKTEDVALLATSSHEDEQPQLYLDTDIYKASRQIRKMQRLDSKVLTTWYDDPFQNNTPLKLI